MEIVQRSSSASKLSHPNRDGAIGNASKNGIGSGWECGASATSLPTRKSDCSSVQIDRIS